MDNDGGLLDRAALVDLVRRIQEFDGEDDELTELVHRFNTVVAHPAWSDLIYYTNEIRSPEAIVDEALSYRPIPVGTPAPAAALPPLYRPSGTPRGCTDRRREPRRDLRPFRPVDEYRSCRVDR